MRSGLDSCFTKGEIECGTQEEKNMTIHHYGFGYLMYAQEDSTCMAVQGEGHHHFVLYDVMNSTICKDFVHVRYDFN